MYRSTVDVVTGGAGFIGSHISRRLLECGGRVRVLDNLLTGRRENLEALEADFGERLEFVEADVRDGERLRGLFRGVRYVFHQAAITSVQRSVDDPLESDDVNVRGTLQVLLGARECGVEKVILATSTSVYGDSEVLPKVEEMAPDPVSPYAVTKAAGEMYCGVFSRIYGLPTLGLRYFNVFGPRQDPRSDYAAVIPRFISRMLRGERPIIFGDGRQSRDFIFVEDVVTANLAAAEAEAQGTVLNIGCGRRLDLNRIVTILNEILGTELEPLYEAPRSGDVRHSVGDVSKARETIEFEPAISFEEGLRRTVDWYRASDGVA